MGKRSGWGRMARARWSMALGAVLLAGVAGAQGTDERSDDDDDPTKLDAVVVTVERREQDLQEFAGTAQSLSAEDLRALGINNELRNLQVLVPGMNIANQEGNLEIFIRGVGSANNTELGDPGAAPHLNGAYIPRPRGLGTMFYDLERVEIHKGPQGTLRGRNAVAGTMNIVTRRPDVGGEFSGFAQGEIANRSGDGSEFGMNLPLGGSAALRFAGYHVDKDSSFVNAGNATHLEPAGAQNETAGRLSFLYQPDDRLSVFLMADYGDEEGTGYPGANIYGAAREGFDVDDLDMRRVVYRGPQGKMDNQLWGAMGDLSYDFGGVRLDYQFSYREVDFSQRNASSDGIDWPGRDLDGIDYDVFSTVFWQTRSQSQTQELRLSSPDDARLRWTAGGFYFQEDQQVGFFSLADRGYCCYSGTEFTMPDVDGEAWALFGDGTFDINEQFRIKGGLRYTDEKKSRFGIGGNWALVLGGADFACCFGTRLGTEGFLPTLLDRPNFNVVGLTTPAQLAQFLLEGIRNPGLRDTLIGQLGGVIGGTAPNGTCIDRPDTDNGFVNCPPDGQHSFLSLTIPSQQRGSSAFDFIDWRLGLEYDLDPDHMIYGTLSTAHKSGGFNDSFDPAEIPETFRPEEILALEIGTKNVFQLGGRAATFNASAFYYDYTDQVFQDLTVIAVDVNGDPNGYSLVNRNIGESRVMGLELESMMVLDYGFMLSVNALLLDTKIERGLVADARSQNFGAGGITSNIDLAGNELPLASDYQINLRLQQVLELGNGTFDWQVLLGRRSSYFLSQFNNRDVVFLSDVAGTVDRVEDAQTAGFPDEQPGFTQLNLGLGYTSSDGRWRFEAFGSNLLNEDVSQKSLVGSALNVRFLNDARSYGARVRYEF
jgi:iron complex outermembrane receptor protein